MARKEFGQELYLFFSLLDKRGNFFNDVTVVLFLFLTAGAKLVLPKGELPQLRKLHGSATSLASSVSSNRPRGPPPPTPANASSVVNLSQPLNRNGRSTESLSSAPSDGEFNDKPSPPVRGILYRLFGFVFPLDHFSIETSTES